MAKKENKQTVMVGKDEVEVEVIPYNDPRAKKLRAAGGDSVKAGLTGDFMIESPYAGGGAGVNVISGDAKANNAANQARGDAGGDDTNTASAGAAGGTRRSQ
jgi:hypothetical protein